MIDTELIKHETSIIQDVIKRMASNSFLIKGWTISLLVIILIFEKEKMAEADVFLFVLLIIFPIISFWYLDAYFLRKERLFRELYSWTIKKRLKEDYELPYDLNIGLFSKKVPSTFRIMFSGSLLLFYLIPIVTISMLMGYKIFMI